jgi:hypothetical protein
MRTAARGDGVAAIGDAATGDAAAVGAGDSVAGGALVGDPPEQATTTNAARLRIPWRLTGRIFG